MLRTETLHRVSKQFFTYVVIGLISAAIHLSVVVLLVQDLGWAPLRANVVGFLTAVQMSYWGNRCFTFRETVVRHHVAFARLLLLQATLFVTNECLFSLLLMWHIPYIAALVMVLAVLPLVAFVSLKRWVF